MGKAAIVIPAYEPDERLVRLIDELTKRRLGPIYLVDDGSGQACAPVFDGVAKAVADSGGRILRHGVNRGKGRALKTAFACLLRERKDLTSAVTADADGQHTGESIERVLNASLRDSRRLILGVRSFDRAVVPWKSRVGNRLTEKAFQFVTGAHITDTQTGLRALPMAYLPRALRIRGEGFEYETRLLLDAVAKLPVTEIPIQTVYDAKTGHRTHFDPWRDSAKICRVLWERFFYGCI